MDTDKHGLKERIRNHGKHGIHGKTKRILAEDTEKTKELKNSTANKRE